MDHNQQDIEPMFSIFRERLLSMGAISSVQDIDSP